VVLFERNVKEIEQLHDLVRALRKVVPEAVIAIEAEGGQVDLLKEMVGPAPSAALLARHAPSLSLQAGQWIGRAMRLFDLDMDFAPMVDLDRGETDNALDGRYLGSAPETILPRAQAFLRGLHTGGVGGCLKHFPGLGGAGEDTRQSMSCVYLPTEELRTDLMPFQSLARLAGAVMVAHALYPAYDATSLPATLSPQILGGVLRGRLGFDGLALSDDLEMKALDAWGELPDRAQASFAAGCDVVLVCHTLEALPAVVERLELPSLGERVAEAWRRFDTYRQRLRTLRDARDYMSHMRESTRGERLETIQMALEQIRESAEREARG
jgi:beta-N-acetylhexosaminidase